MKRIFMVILGVLFLLVGAGIGFMLLQYLVQGTGLQFLPVFNASTILIGWINVTGMLLASGICFCLGCYWCAEAAVTPEKGASGKDVCR